jgi:hypothetical protein
MFMCSCKSMICNKFGLNLETVFTIEMDEQLNVCQSNFIFFAAHVWKHLSQKYDFFLEADNILQRNSHHCGGIECPGWGSLIVIF